jgi:hypothetical protein
LWILRETEESGTGAQTNLSTTEIARMRAPEFVRARKPESAFRGGRQIHVRANAFLTGHAVQASRS